jgi:hypothetical protein
VTDPANRIGMLLLSNGLQDAIHGALGERRMSYDCLGYSTPVTCCARIGVMLSVAVVVYRTGTFAYSHFVSNAVA